ncbi:unnamed protein product, partial [Trichobilharzia regenti]
MCSIDINDDNNDNDADIDNNSNENSKKSVTPDRGSAHSIHPVTRMYTSDDNDSDIAINNNTSPISSHNDDSNHNKKTVTPDLGSSDCIHLLTQMCSIDINDVNDANIDNNSNRNSKKSVTPDRGSTHSVHPVTQTYKNDNDDDSDNNGNDNSKKTVTPRHGSPDRIPPLTEMFSIDDSGDEIDNNYNDSSKENVTPHHGSPDRIPPLTEMFSIDDDADNSVNDNSKKTVTPDPGSSYYIHPVTQMCNSDHDDMNNYNNDNNSCNDNNRNLNADNDKNANNNSNDISIKKDDNDIYNDNNFIHENNGNCNNDKNDNICDNDSEISMNNNAVLLSRSSEMCNQLSTDKLMSSIVTLSQAKVLNFFLRLSALFCEANLTAERVFNVLRLKLISMYGLIAMPLECHPKSPDVKNLCTQFVGGEIKSRKGVEPILGRLMHESQCDIKKSLVNNHLLPSQSSTLRGKRRITNYDARLIAEAKLLAPMSRRRERKPLYNPDYLEFISLKDVVIPPKLTSPKSNCKRKNVNKPSQFSIDHKDDCTSLDLKDANNICCPKSTLSSSTENHCTEVESTSNDLAPPLLLSEHPSELTVPDTVAEPVLKCDPDSVVAPEPVADAKTAPEKCQPRPHYYFRKTKCNYLLRRVVHIASPPLLQAVPSPTVP